MFSHLIGNEEVKQRLTRLLESGRLPSSLLFAGPEGVGKKLFAVEIARSFVCQTLNRSSACSECAACKRVNEFNIPTSEKGEDYDNVFFSDHPDVGLVIPYKRNLRVGAIRALEIQANFRPYEARARVFILDDAEKMNDAASNALLKTLEEPAESTYIILITSRPDSLLRTIRSRCQTIRFAPVSSTAIATMIRESVELTAEDAHLAAKASGGSVGRAMAFDLAAYRIERDAQIAIVKAALIDKNRSRLIASSERLNDAKNKDSYEKNLEILELVVRDLWLIKNGSSRDTVTNIDVYDELRAIAESVEKQKLAEFLAEIESLRASLNVNINRKMATDALFMKMSA